MRTSTRSLALLTALSILPVALAAAPKLDVVEVGTVGLALEGIPELDREGEIDLWKVELRAAFDDGVPFGRSRDAGRSLAYAEFESMGVRTLAVPDAEGWVRAKVPASHAEVGEVAFAIRFLGLPEGSHCGCQDDLRELARFQWTRTEEDGRGAFAGGQGSTFGRLSALSSTSLGLKAEILGAKVDGELRLLAPLPETAPEVSIGAFNPALIGSAQRVELAEFHPHPGASAPAVGGTLILWSGALGTLGTISSVQGPDGNHRWVPTLLSARSWAHLVDRDVKITWFPHTQPRPGGVAVEGGETALGSDTSLLGMGGDGI